MPWIDHPIHFVDFEGNRASGILEFGVATLVGGSVTRCRTRLCRPSGRVLGSETAVHGLSEASLEGAPAFAEEWEYFAGLRQEGVLAAHFAGVENALLKSVWPYPRQSPDFARPGERIANWGPWVDTAPLYTQRYPTLESARLEALVASAGLQPELDARARRHCPVGRRRYHAALYDALAGALLLGLLARDPQTASLTLPQLLALSTLDPRKRDDLRQRELFG